MKKIVLVCVVVLLAAVCLCACKSTDTQEQPTTGVPNPITTYSSVDGINDAVGFDMVTLPPETGFTPEDYETIDGAIAQMVYTNEDGATVTVRMAEGSDDISGVYGVEYGAEEFHGVQAQMGTYNGVSVALVQDDTYTYSLMGEDVDAATFDNLVAEFIYQAFGMGNTEG